MARYLIQFSVAPQAAAGLIQNPSNRAEAVGPIFEAVGGRLEQYYVEVGGSNGYIVAEIPDQESVGAVTMAVLAGGAVTFIKATAIVTAEEAVECWKKAASLTYRPPQG
jgi:uncharacterized protein with GYD domain